MCNYQNLSMHLIVTWLFAGVEWKTFAYLCGALVRRCSSTLKMKSVNTLFVCAFTDSRSLRAMAIRRTTHPKCKYGSFDVMLSLPFVCIWIPATTFTCRSRPIILGLGAPMKKAKKDQDKRVKGFKTKDVGSGIKDLLTDSDFKPDKSLQSGDGVNGKNKASWKQ